MEGEVIIYCSECRQSIVPGEDFVRFKVPGKGIYQCFHRRFNVGDCWERRLQQGVEALIGFMTKAYGDKPAKKHFSLFRGARGDVYARREVRFGF